MNGKTIAPISAAMNISAEILYNEVSKLNFTVPKQHDGVETEYYDDITSLRILDWHNVGRFIIVDPVITDSGIRETKEVTAYSLEYEFTFKKITLEESTYNFWNPVTPDSTVLGIIMSYMPSWSVGEVDDSLVGKYRTFDANEDNIYDFMKSTLQTTYSCIFEFDTYQNLVHVRDASKAAKQKPVYFSTENLVKELVVEEKSDDIVTVLDVSGAEGVDIRAVNPLGTNKIYNLDYYMTETNFSAEMIAKWNAWKQNFENYQQPYYDLVMQRNLLIASYETELAALTDIKGEYSKYDNQRAVTIQAIAQRLESQAALNAINAQLNNVQGRINSQQSKVGSIKNSIDDLTRRLQEINRICSFNSFFTESEYEQLSRYFIEDAVQDSTFVASTVPSYTKKKVYTKVSESQSVRLSVTNGKISMKRLGENEMLYTITGGDVVINKYVNGELTDVIQADVISGALNAVTGDETTTEHPLTVSLYLSNGVQNGTAFKTSNFTFSGNVWNIILGGGLTATLDNGGYTVTEDTTEFDRSSVEWELYQFGSDILQTKSSVTYSFDLDLEDFLSLDAFRKFKSEIELGKRVYLKVAQGVIQPVVVGMDIDYDAIETVKIQFGSSFDINNSTYDLIDLTREAVNMGRRVDFSKYSFNQFIDSGASTSVNEFMNSALDAAVNSIISSSGQAFSVDGTGIRLRQWKDEDEGTYEDEQIWMNNNSIMFTKDNWSTASIGIGKFVDDNLGSLYGIVAPNIVGTLIAGENLVIESQKKSGDRQVFKVDADGVTLYNGDIDVNYGDAQITISPTIGIAVGKYNLKNQDGTLNENNAQFWVDTEGNVHMKGHLEAATGTFSGELRAATGTFQGSMTAGSININNQFMVDSSGNVTANSGIFKGTLQGANYQTANGTPMMNSSGQFISDYLSLKGINITNNAGQTSFAVSNSGEITINGNVTMGSGSTINWANVNEQNTQWNQAYQVSTNALNTANTANSNAMTANNNASTAQSTAASAQLAAYYAQNQSQTVANNIQQIVNGTYQGGAFISGKVLYYPQIMGTSIFGNTIQFGMNGAYGYLQPGTGSSGSVVELYGTQSVRISSGGYVTLAPGNGAHISLACDSYRVDVLHNGNWHSLGELFNAAGIQ